jgi:hypothetical protein
MTVSTWDMYDTYEQLREAQNAAAGNENFSCTYNTICVHVQLCEPYHNIVLKTRVLLVQVTCKYLS